MNSPTPTLRLGNLPVLIPSSRYLMEALSNEEMEYKELADIIAQSPSISARVLAVANSAWSSPPDPITSLELACARLGFQVVRSMAISIAVSSPFDAYACPHFDPERFWSNSLLTAHGARLLTEHMQQPTAIDPASASTAGLLSNLGLLVLVSNLPHETNAALLDADNHTKLADALQQHCGIDHHQAGAYLAEHWQLPSTLHNAMAHRLENDDGHTWQSQCPVSLSLSMTAAIRQADEQAPPLPQHSQIKIPTKDYQQVYTQLQHYAPRLHTLAQMMVKA